MIHKSIWYYLLFTNISFESFCHLSAVCPQSAVILKIMSNKKQNPIELITYEVASENEEVVNEVTEEVTEEATEEAPVEEKTEEEATSETSESQE